MIRAVLILLSVFLAPMGHAQMEGAMVMQGAVREPEKPLTMAGGFK